jgi:predicted NBD/HSP70 family sugar kinase
VSRGTNLEQTREFNRRTVLGTLMRHSSASRTEIARSTGLSLTAVSNIMDDLVETGRVETRGRRTTARGQPPIEYAVAPDGAFAIGVALDRDHLIAVLVDLAGQVRAERRQVIADPTLAEASDAVATFVAELVASLSRPERDRLLGLGVGVPGVMSQDGRVRRMVRLPDWEGHDLVATFGRATSLPTTVVNDAIAAGVGAASFGPMRGTDTFVYVLFALGMGSSLMMRGHPHRGLWKATGRIGHIPIESEGDVCPACGGRGCLAHYVSVEALVDRLQASHRAGWTASLDAIRTRYAEGDDIVEAWLDRAAHALARGLIVLENLIDPDAYVFDGRMPSELLAALVLRTEERYLASRPRGSGDRRLQLRVGDRGDVAVAFGAASVPLYVATTPDLALL